MVRCTYARGGGNGAARGLHKPRIAPAVKDSLCGVRSARGRRDARRATAVHGFERGGGGDAREAHLPTPSALGGGRETRRNLKKLAGGGASTSRCFHPDLSNHCGGFAGCPYSHYGDLPTAFLSSRSVSMLFELILFEICQRVRSEA